MTRRAAFCAIGLMYIAPVAAIIGWAVRTQAVRSIVSVVLATVLIACAAAAMTRTWRRFFLAQWPFSLLSLVFATYAITFNMAPGRTLARVLAGASFEEVTGFLKFSQGLWLSLALAAWSVAYLGLVLCVPPRPIFSDTARSRSRLIVLSLVLLDSHQ